MKNFICCVACLLLVAGAASADKTKVRWYVGLGGGSDAPTFQGQKDVVDQFNASQNDIELTLEIVANAQAYDTLSVNGGRKLHISGG